MPATPIPAPSPAAAGLSAELRTALSIARAALRVAADALPPYAHRFSPRKFTQHQIFGILAVRHFLNLDYRGVVRVLAATPELRRALELSALPHYSTLCYAEGRLLGNHAVTGFLMKLFAKPPSAA